MLFRYAGLSVPVTDYSLGTAEIVAVDDAARAENGEADKPETEGFSAQHALTASYGCTAILTKQMWFINPLLSAELISYSLTGTMVEEGMTGRFLNANLFTGAAHPAIDGASILRADTQGSASLDKFARCSFQSMSLGEINFPNLTNPALTYF